MAILVAVLGGIIIGLVIGVSLPDKFYIWPPKLWGKRPEGD